MNASLPQKKLSKDMIIVEKSRRGHRMCAIHILECISKIEYICSIDPEMKNAILYDAVVRNLQTLSESTRYIRKDIREQYTHIPWKLIRHLRNELVHGYLTVNTDIAVRTLIRDDMKSIKKILEHYYPNWQKESKYCRQPLLGKTLEPVL